MIKNVLIMHVSESYQILCEIADIFFCNCISLNATKLQKTHLFVNGLLLKCSNLKLMYVAFGIFWSFELCPI